MGRCLVHGEPDKTHGGYKMPNAQLFTDEARRRLVAADETGDLEVCERGVLDTEEGIPVSDVSLLAVLTQRGVNIREALVTPTPDEDTMS